MMPLKRGRPCPAGYQMVDSFAIRNFRGFNEVKVEDCRLINVLVGDNGSGKTTLLEALFLAAGVSPEIAVRTRGWRGQENQQLSGSHEDIIEALWADMFYMFRTNQAAFVSMKGSGEENRSVSVFLNRVGQVRAIPPDRKRPAAKVRVEPVLTPIEFRWKIQGLPDVIVEPKFQGNELSFPPVPARPIRAAFFASNRTSGPLETAGRFSELSRSFIENDFVERFTRVFPTIKNIGVELSAGTPLLFASVEGLPRKIPLNLASGGMNKLAAILLSITDQSGGIVIVDEIENGFFHKRLPIIWETLLDFARLYRCQLFVSTHSDECLQAAAALAKEAPDEFCMMRTVKEGDGTKVRRFDGERFASAILADVEVR